MGEEPEPQNLEELRGFLAAEFVECSSWEAEGVDPAGGFRFSCGCGQASSVYDSYAEGARLMDEHNDQLEAARGVYARTWFERHPPTAAGEISGDGWAVHVLPNHEPNPATGQPRFHLVMTSGSSRGPENEDGSSPEDERSGSPAALDFPIYGCDDSWTGERWVDGVARGWDEEGNESATVWLGHGSSWFPDPASPWVVVGTVSREREARIGDRDPDTTQRLASESLSLLMHRTAPRLPREQDRRLHHAFAEEESQRADAYARWARVTWLVAGQSFPARVVEWAGGWAGFSTAAPTVSIMVVAHGVSPDGVQLAPAGDGSSYHVNFAEVGTTWKWTEQSVMAAFGDLEDVQPTEWPVHPDHARLLGA